MAPNTRSRSAPTRPAPAPKPAPKAPAPKPAPKNKASGTTARKNGKKKAQADGEGDAGAADAAPAAPHEDDSPPDMTPAEVARFAALQGTVEVDEEDDVAGPSRPATARRGRGGHPASSQRTPATATRRSGRQEARPSSSANPAPKALATGSIKQASAKVKQEHQPPPTLPTPPQQPPAQPHNESGYEPTGDDQDPGPDSALTSQLAPDTTPHSSRARTERWILELARNPPVGAGPPPPLAPDRDDGPSHLSSVSNAPSESASGEESGSASEAEEEESETSETQVAQQPAQQPKLLAPPQPPTSSLATTPLPDPEPQPQPLVTYRRKRAADPGPSKMQGKRAVRAESEEERPGRKRPRTAQDLKPRAIKAKPVRRRKPVREEEEEEDELAGGSSPRVKSEPLDDPAPPPKAAGTARGAKSSAWTADKKRAVMDHVVSLGVAQVDYAKLSAEVGISVTALRNQLQKGHKGNLRDKAISGAGV
ncbi:hypothetical protein Q8F55_007892 [Vanrija albida]|uniref:Uncharacterized protein n=1 Tax=Vanrija albida TaxID=181172 RepID=A0ABR3PV06_9TREE